MIRDITIGQYYNRDSVIHRLDPRTKIIIAFVYVISLFFDKNPVLYAVAILTLAIYIGLSKVSLRYIVKGLKPLAFILLFTMLLNLFSVKGTTVIWEWKGFKITTLGICMAIYLGLRLMLIVIGSSMMTYTTTPNSLTDGLEKMLGFLKKIKVPVHEFAMIMSIALRFIPVLVEELDKIMKAQMARGIDFQEGNIFVRIRKLLPIIIPLFVAAIRRSNELALAMDARCYHGGEGRTKMKPLQYKRNDWIAYVLVALYIVMMVLLALKF